MNMSIDVLRAKGGGLGHLRFYKNISLRFSFRIGWFHLMRRALNFSLRFIFFLLSGVCLSLPSLRAADPFAEMVRKTEPLSPEEQRRLFHLPEGFEIVLVASEPSIAKP